MEAKPLPKLSAKAEEIIDIIGAINGEAVNAIIRTGASLEEIRKAFEWEEEEEYIGEGPEGPEGRIKLVYDILKNGQAYSCRYEEDNNDY